MGIRNFTPIATSFDRVRELFDYNPDSGLLVWKTINKFWKGRIKVGDRAGYVDHGYRRTCIDGVVYLEHRVIWFWMTGNDDPTVEIDHKDRNGENNKWNNLRQASPAQNQANKPKANKLNKYGYKGIGKTIGNKYFACISERGKWRHLGVFETPKEAHNRYCEEARKLYGDYFDDGSTIQLSSQQKEI